MRVAIYGAGGHGKVVWDVLTCQGHAVVGFIDDAPTAATIHGLPVAKRLDELDDVEGVIVAIGNNRIRREKFEMLRGMGLQVVNAIHPTAVLSSHVTLGCGVVVMPRVVVNVDTVIGDNVILNTGASVDHDCTIGNHVHIAPGTTLGGGVGVGEGAFLGIGTCVIPCQVVGAWAVVGAGGVVVREVSAASTVIGVPAKVLRQGNAP